MNRNQSFGALLFGVGALLLVGTLIDASSVASIFGVASTLPEASVALLGLVVSAACFVAAFRVSRRPALAADAA